MMANNKNINDLFAVARTEQHPNPVQTTQDIANLLPSKRKLRTPIFPFIIGLVVLSSFGFYLWNRPEDEQLSRQDQTFVEHNTYGNSTSTDIETTNTHTETTNTRLAPKPESSGADIKPRSARISIINNHPRLSGDPTPAQPNSFLTLVTDDDEVYVAALLADEDVFRSLSIEPTAVKEICRNLAGADSVTNCSGGSHDTQVKVCVFTDGNQDEVVFMDRPGPMPVMFTSALGRGRVVTSRYSSEVDPNKLIPVAAHGCGGNVLMWFSPTEEFVYSLPDSLSNELNGVVELDLRMNAFGKNLHIRKKLSALDTLLPKHLKSTLDSVLSSLKFNVDSLSSSLNLNLEELQKQLGIKKPSGNNRNQSLQPNVEQRILIMRCGRVDNKAAIPNTSTPLQETRTADGALSRTTIYPNPATDGGVTISFELREPRLLTVNLLDLGGTTIKSWTTNAWKNTGTNQIACMLDGVPAGMYLVTITTDRNERVVQRLIVQ